MLTPEKLENVYQILKNPSIALGERFRALFTLRNVNTPQSIDYIGNVLLNDTSALLKHECAYCLGQMQQEHAIDVLKKVLSNVEEHPMVRHEAGEALGAIGTDQCLQILKEYANDPCKDVRETVQLAINRIEYVEKGSDQGDCVYTSVDPAPPLKTPELAQDCESLQSVLTNPDELLFKRYQAMFSLRNYNTDESALALASGLECPDSALFRHEIAFVLGQMQKPVTLTKLAACLAREDENEMVRHECAEAIGSIATDEANEILKTYIDDQKQVVRESVIVALDMSDYNNSDQFQLLE